jgi:hypothetical protein
MILSGLLYFVGFYANLIYILLLKFYMLKIEYKKKRRLVLFEDKLKEIVLFVEVCCVLIFRI